MKKILILFMLSITTVLVYSQDTAMVKKMDNKTDKMVKKTEHPNDPMVKKLPNAADTSRNKLSRGKLDTLKRKRIPKQP